MVIELVEDDNETIELDNDLEMMDDEVSTATSPSPFTCDAPNPGCPLTTHQPAENLYVSCYETHT